MLPGWIPSQGTATRSRWCMSWGHRAPFGAFWGPFWGPFETVLGPNDTVDRVKTGKTRVKGTPHVALGDSVPRHDHRTPPAPIPEPSGPVWAHFGGHLRAKLAHERTPWAGNVHNRVQQDPSDGCLGSRDPSGGAWNLNGEFQFLARF